MSKHTPGPWIVTGSTGRINQIGIGEPGANYTIPLGCVYGRPDDDITKANARLVAAAPELLQSLKDVLPLIKYTDDAGWEKVKRARQLIEKAE